MSNSEPARKLTDKDLPELADHDASPEERYYCRVFKEAWGGWELVGCYPDVHTENDCAAKASRGDDYAYSWTRKKC